MKPGEIIRKRRRDNNWTQEEIAGRLGVTAAAVNKWENGNSYPDIMLLGPIARLLGISIDELLSFKDELTDLEISQIIGTVKEKIQNEDFDEVFCWTMDKIREYPNDEKLAFYLVQILDSHRSIFTAEDDEKYNRPLMTIYERILKSKDAVLVQGALAALFNRCMCISDYEQAEYYLGQIPPRGINPDTFRALLERRRGNDEAAYKLYERQIFEGYHNLTQALQGIFSLSVKAQNMAKAERIVKVQEQLADTLEMGEYQKLYPGLGLALERQDKAASLRILTGLVHSLKETPKYSQSYLYSHLQASASVDASYIAYILLKGFEEDDEIGFLKDDKQFDYLIQELKDLVANTEKI